MAQFNARRVLKSSIPIATFIFFTILVTFHLYYRPVSLGNLQHIGWQAYDIVSFGNVTVLPPSKPAQGPGSPPNDTSPDWWEVENEEKEPGPTSFRLDVWNPLTPHHTGRKLCLPVEIICMSLTSLLVTEIAVKSCLFDPDLVSYCNPRKLIYRI